MKTKFAVCTTIIISLLLMLGAASYALTDTQLRDLALSKETGSLKDVEVPEPPNLDAFVRNKPLAIVLGKALFWDMQAGSDGQACASCHFHAGADNRAKNQLNPGQRGGDNTFDVTLSGGGGPNYTLICEDFPFPANDTGDPDYGFNDVASSMGAFNADFVNTVLRQADDICDSVPDDVFNVDDINVRRVEPRNTPTVINAVFNHRNFWDGRANDKFNGNDPLGRRGTQGVWSYTGGTPEKVDLVGDLELKVSSLASQAVGPPLSPEEMSCRLREFPDLGRKMINMIPLALQSVHPQDSVLGRYRRSTGKGLFLPYRTLIMYAFQPRWWAYRGTVDGGFTQMEANFSLFWGLAIQLYEATLVSDETPFDIFMGHNGTPGENNPVGFGDAEKRGLEVFLDKGRCINCHDGPEFTGASVALRACQPFGNEQAIEQMEMGDLNIAVYDGGFYNIGVRPWFEDLGVGAELPPGKPLSFSRQHVNDPENTIDEFCFQPPITVTRVAVDGAFKTPTTRNVELTAPFMHNGGQATLEQVVEFYDRGGDFPYTNQDHLDPDINDLDLTDAEKADLVAFMKALTDPRVNQEMAPFDHPELLIPNGHPGDEFFVDDTNGDGVADDELITIPAVGRYGREPLGEDPLRDISFDSGFDCTP